MKRRLSQEEEEKEVTVEIDFLTDGIERARKALERGALADTTVGCKVLRETIGKLVPAIEAEQKGCDSGARCGRDPRQVGRFRSRS